MFSNADDPRIVIVGAGFAGICMAIKLQEQGFRNFEILEQAASVGGTWRDNTYPGAACDVMSHLYSFSFFQHPGWSMSYSSWNEIQAYLNNCVDAYKLRDRIQFNAEVVRAEYLHEPTGDNDYLWRVVVAKEGNQEAMPPRYCHYLVSASGVFSRIAVPSFPKEGSGFQGSSFHTGRWDNSVSLEGKRVAVIGTGASAIQAIPEIAKVAKHVVVFQRSAAWVLAKVDLTYPAWMKALFKYVPLFLWLSRLWIYCRHELLTILFVTCPSIFRVAERLGKKHIASQVSDPAMRKLLTPDYNIGCKRILISNVYYPAMTSKHVSVVTQPIQAIAPAGVVTTDGVTHEVDVIVYATGFQITNVSGMHAVIGRSGEDLRDVWTREGQYAFLGTFVHDYPNFIFLVGPNSGLGTNSIVFMIECQVNMVIRLLKKMAKRKATRLEVRKDVETAFNARIQQALKGTLWLSCCKSWYLNAKGRNTTMWPYTTLRYWWETATVAESAFTITN